MRILPGWGDPLRESPAAEASLANLIATVRAQGLEGLVAKAKRLESRYEPGQRTGAWQKMRINRGQEFVIGSYTLGTDRSMHSSSVTSTATGWCTRAGLGAALRRRRGKSCGDCSTV
jgi:ATP-dependent DNA ligase